jgi:hypothetical protein
VASVLWARRAQIPYDGLAQFVTIRITLLNMSFAVVFAVLWKQCLTAFGLYRRDIDGLGSLLMRCTPATATMTGLLAVYLDARHARGPQSGILFAFFACVFLYETGRVLLCGGKRSWKMGAPERVLILGSCRRASKAWRHLRIQHRHTTQLLGFVDDRSPSLMAPDIAARYIAAVDELPGFFSNHAVDELIVAVPMESCFELAQRAVSIAQAAGVRVVFLNDLFPSNTERAFDLQNAPFLELSSENKGRQSTKVAKRALDVLGAATAMVTLTPVFLIISLAIKLTSPGSVLALDLKILASTVPAIFKRF